jgi:REP element-mobilizing transposase RayT
MSSQPDADNFPLAYLITFRSYGTWLHGDARGSVDRKHNVYGTPRLYPNESLKEAEERQLRHPPVILNAARRRIIKEAIREVCQARGYRLLAVNVRTNHVHSVIAAKCKPDRILNALKAYATRKLRRSGLIPTNKKPWVRKGSKRWLWKEKDVDRAIAYVMFEQGEDPFE